ncbi:biotin--[acetyl-CoA-carboxylase] ligase [Thermosipho globiformans]|uniref:biotin--[acetyl-CoA-carboxylase] ligase n=1 Tax=Thermosipho globiformans TaxID=380685 RepID=UPI000F8D0390|nr:biotin--[acetyl-CoA-carboxylase] ligase [Thermosipho globiformans]
MLEKSKLICFDKINSTNTYVKENYKNLDSGTIVLAKVQTQGRGRLGRVWISQEGGLWFSILFKKNLKYPNFYTKLSAITLLSILKNLKISAKIKWPNDIFFKGKKLSGILTEIISKNEKVQAIVVGIGLNVNNETPPEGTSISKVTGKKFEINLILEIFINKFNIYYKFFRLFPFLLTIAWKKNLIFKRNDTINGYKIKKITSEYLIVQKNDLKKKINSIHELEGG